MKGNHVTVPGLFVVIAATCITLVCIVSISLNIVTFCIAKRNIKKTNRDRALLRANRLEANCPFIITRDEEEAGVDDHPVLASLADFLQYSMHSESNSESNRMSWV